MEQTSLEEIQRKTARTAIEAVSGILEAANSSKFKTNTFQALYDLVIAKSIDKTWEAAKDALAIVTKDFIPEGETLIGLRVNGRNWPITLYFDQSNPPQKPKVLTEVDLRLIYLKIGGKEDKTDDLFRLSRNS